MKKIISLCLVVVMLLGMVAMTASADSAEETGISVSASLYLDNYLNIKVYFDGIDANTTYTATINGEAAALDGDCVVLEKLTPLDVMNEYTVELIAGDNVVKSAKVSLKTVCDSVLNDMSWSNEFHSLAVDILNYCSAAQAYNGEQGALANATMTPLQSNLATAPSSPEYGVVTDDSDVNTITWSNASLYLKESTTYKLYFTTDLSLEELKEFYFEGTFGGSAITTISGAAAKQDGEEFYIEFEVLNPADLDKELVITPYAPAGTAAGKSLTFSAERYAYAVLNGGYEQGAKNLVNSLLSYSNGANAFNADPANEHLFANAELRDIATGALTAAEKYRLSAVIAENFTALEMSKFDKHICGAYKQIGVDVSKYYPGTTSFTNIFYYIWSGAGSLTSNPNSWNRSLLKGCWGGTYHSDKIPAGTCLDITLSTFEVGDVFVGRFKVGDDTFNFRMGIYLGGGKFLALSNAGVGEIWTYDVNGTESIYNWIEKQDAAKWYAYYILRPSQLAN